MKSIRGSCLSCGAPVAALLLLAGLPAGGAISVWTPQQARPAFLEPGGSFEAEIKGASDFASNEWQAVVMNDLTNWTCAVAAARYATIHHGAEPGWVLTISTPASTPPETLMLRVTHPVGGAAVSTQSVSVVSRLEEDFYIVQFADLHVDAEAAVEAGGKSSTTWETGSADSVRWGAPVINLINPRFVYYSGDNNHLYFSSTSWCGWDEAIRRCGLLKTAWTSYTVPVVAASGNHDIGWSGYTNSVEWRAEYANQFGPRAFSFRMGSFYTLINEWTYNTYMAWATADYRATWSDPTVTYRLVGQHFDDGPGGWTTVPDADYPCDLAIVGHNHTTAKLRTSPYVSLSAATALDHQKGAVYRFLKNGAGWTSPDAAGHAEGVNVLRVVGDWGTPKVSATFAVTNNGTASSNRVTIVNDLPMDFFNGRVRFLMPAGTYTVAGGTVEAKYDYDGGKKTAILVRVNIRANAASEVSVQAESPPTVAPTAAWKSVAMGGGGYVTGIAVHPSEADLIYIRTDVGGAYRWDPASGKWAPLLDWIDPTNSKLLGVDGIAVDPSDANVVYAALGRDLVSYGGVFKSTDRGAHWTKVLSATFDANGSAFRWCGECLAVDPLSSSTVYCGTRRQGLFRSTDGGTTWVHAADVPAGYTNANPSGIRAVAIDSSSSAGGRSQRVYATIPGTGIYRSQDGGATFAAMSGAPVNPHRIHAAPGGVLVVTHAAGVALFDGSAWRTITPSDALNQPFAAVTVDPTNANRIVVSKYATAFGNALYRSSDAGATWQKLGTTGATITKHIEVPWWPAEYFSSATASLAADPHHPGRVLFTDWFGVWNTPDVWASATHWYTMENGHEETCVIELAAPPAGPPLVSCMADVSGFSHTNLDAYPGARLPTGNEGVDVDFCESQPQCLAMLGATSWDGNNTKLITSSNSAADWTVRTLPSGSTLGKLACSAGDPARLVYCPGGGVPCYSADGGASWTVSQGAPTGAVGLTDIWNRDNALAADRGDGNRFYLYQAGKMYVSTDGGAVWALTNSSLPAKGGYYLRVASAPGGTGEVWVSLDANGLWRSSDGGRTFTKIAWFDRSRLLTFGCAASVTNAASAYVYGVHGGEWGLYRSTDLGATWTRVNNPQGAEDACQFAGAACALAADRRVFGRVYVGTGGRGIIYGDTAAPASPNQLTATAAATNRIDLSWGDNAKNETGYVIQRSPDSNTWGFVTLAAVNATNYSDTGLATNTLYHYRVAATNAVGLSACAYASARTWTAYESWQHAFFTPDQLTNSAVSGNDADPDEDGFTNWKECAAGTDPTNTASSLALVGPTNNVVAAGKFVVCWQSVSGKTYALQATTDLLLGFTDILTGIQSTPPMNVHTDSVGSAAVKFYKVRLD